MNTANWSVCVTVTVVSTDFFFAIMKSLPAQSKERVDYF